MSHALVAGISSGIGEAIAHHLADNGWSLTGTTRRGISPSLRKRCLSIITCDFKDAGSVDEAATEVMNSSPPWDAMIVMPGTLKPIGRFPDIDIDAWSQSLDVNLVNQLRFVHRLLPHADVGKLEMPSCIFFAGGGTNSAPIAFSAYVLSKIALIKATEILDAEIPEVSFSILGPGWVKTAIHDETLSAELAPATVLRETRRRLDTEDFVAMSDVVTAIDWILTQPKDVVGGRNFSVCGDPFEEPEFAQILAHDPSLLKLRRWGNDAPWRRDAR